MFSQDFVQINYVAVLVAAAASFVVGGIWYGALFAKAWVRLHGFNKADIDQMAKQQPRNFAAFFAGDLVTCIVLWLVMSSLNVQSALSGLVLAMVVWLGFQVPQCLSKALAGNKPMALFGIDISHQLASLAVMGLIIGAWH